jgi:hypothetical protein
MNIDLLEGLAKMTWTVAGSIGMLWLWLQCGKWLAKYIRKEGLKKLLGERITVFCANYIYTGKLTGINNTCILLENGGIVYETGSFSDKSWKDMQSLPGEWYVMLQSIESFGLLK